MSVKLITNELALADPDFRNDLVNNFTIIDKFISELNNLREKKLEVLENKIDDISEKTNIYEANMQEIVNILSDYDVPIQLVNGKVLEIKEGE